MEEIRLPNWAKKPKHKKEVIATKKGWVVKETGEILSSIRGLDTRLKSLQGVDQGKKEEPVEDVLVASTVELEEEKVDEIKAVAKKATKKTTNSKK